MNSAESSNTGNEDGSGEAPATRVRPKHIERFENTLTTMTSADAELYRTKSGWHAFSMMTHFERIKMVERIRELGNCAVADWLESKLYMKSGRVRRSEEAVINRFSEHSGLSQNRDVIIAAGQSIKGYDGSLMRLVIMRPGAAPQQSIIRAASILIAAGFSTEETAKRCGMPEEWVASAVTPDMVAADRKTLDERIVELADGKVLRDLLDDKTDETTEKVDKIAERRRKLKLDKVTAAKDMMSAEDKARLSGDIAARFGLASVTDAQSIEVSSENLKP